MAQGQGIRIANDLRNYVNTKSSQIQKNKGNAFINLESKDASIGGQIVDDSKSVIFKAFEENQHWRDAIVICDWTGSMYPYMGQVLAFHVANLDKRLVKELVLFNDGDKKKIKPIGETGGIYFSEPDTSKLYKVIEKAVDNGNGGDSPENDVEAILEAQKKYPNAPYYILIADDSPIRDISIAKQIKKPVHVILVNTNEIRDYLYLAKVTKGSVTTWNEKIDFSAQKTRNKFVFLDKEYDLSK